MRLAIVCALAALPLTGCITTPPNEVFLSYDHLSHPLLGPPFGPATDEGTLDTVGVTARWVRGKAFVETGLSYVVPGGDLYGDDFLFNGRVGYRLFGKGDK
jgi:hypothetical protein